VTGRSVTVNSTSPTKLVRSVRRVMRLEGTPSTRFVSRMTSIWWMKTEGRFTNRPAWWTAKLVTESIQISPRIRPSRFFLGVI
jgi:hypothetical protein